MDPESDPFLNLGGGGGAHNKNNEDQNGKDVGGNKKGGSGDKKQKAKAEKKVKDLIRVRPRGLPPEEEGWNKSYKQENVVKSEVKVSPVLQDNSH